MAIGSSNIVVGRSAAEMAAETHWWHAVPETGRIFCDLCPRACQPEAGRPRLLLRARKPRRPDGLTTYGRSTGFCIDPIEKKPLNHFYPGTQRAVVRHGRLQPGLQVLPELGHLEVAATSSGLSEAGHARGHRRGGPTGWAAAAWPSPTTTRSCGPSTPSTRPGRATQWASRRWPSLPATSRPTPRGAVLRTHGCGQRRPEGLHRGFLSHAHRRPHCSRCWTRSRWLKHESHVWLEITNLVIPQANDSPDEIRRMCRWMLDELGDDVPLHFTAFHPDFRLTDRPNTPHETLLAAYDMARQEGLKYIYVGNVHDRAHASTYCPGCGELLIDRDWHQLHKYRTARRSLRPRCDTAITRPVRRRAGNWGRTEVTGRHGPLCTPAGGSLAGHSVSGSPSPPSHAGSRCGSAAGLGTSLADTDSGLAGAAGLASLGRATAADPSGRLAVRAGQGLRATTRSGRGRPGRSGRRCRCGAPSSRSSVKAGCAVAAVTWEECRSSRP